ncbi:MAG TPA: aldose 1-epimerase family protein [Rugosimonospora sp.]|nr:aldose 1-epimerase family protein [Rugosimonospora sp.]
MQQTSPPSGTQWQIESGDHQAVVVEVGGGLRAYRVAGQDLLDGYGEDEIAPGGAGQVLAPWPNRIRDGRYAFQGGSYQLPLSEPAHHNASHGLVRWLPWQATEVGGGEVTLECRLPAQPGYPWTLHLRTVWSVGADGLRATHSATNLSGRPCPFGIGVHPYLRLPGVPVDAVKLSVPARSRLLVDARLLPIGAARVAGSEYDFGAARPIGGAVLDTAFGDLPPGGSTVTLSTVDEDRSVSVWADGAFRWWQVYTGDTLPAPRTRRAVAVEPMSCPPDAFSSGRDLVSLAPGETWRGAWGINPKLGA